MEYGLKHAAERKAFEAAVSAAMRKADKSGSEGYVEMVNVIQKVLGDAWPEHAYDNLREALGKDGKWTGYFNNLLKNTDREYLKGLLMSFGFEGGFTGFHRTRKLGQELGIKIPWIILFDPTSACNLHCTGCWASEYSHQLNLSWEDMDRIVTEGKELGIHAYVMTGGEPMVRKRDIVRLARKHPDCGFMLFTNGTLVDQQFCDDMRSCKNIVLSMSIEGDEQATDARRGAGTFRKVMDAMDLLRSNGLAYGTSICYTRANCEAVTGDEFLDFLIDKGVAFSWYFHLCLLEWIRRWNLFLPWSSANICITGSAKFVGLKAGNRSSAWIFRMMGNLSAVVSQVESITAILIPMGMWNLVCLSIIPVQTSMTCRCLTA